MRTRPANVNRKRHRDVQAILLALIAATTARGIGLTRESLWYDEAYSVWSSAMDIASLQVLWSWRIEFPLYYLLLHYWMWLFGSGELAVRAFGAAAGILTVVPMYFWAREILGRRGALYATLLLAINPYHVWYSQEVRMYAWALLFSQVALYAYWRFLRSEKHSWWLAHALLTGLTLHLHYYVAWIVLVENVLFLPILARRSGGIRGRSAWKILLWWLLDQLIVLLFALPALVVFTTKMQTYNQWGWLAERYGAPTWHSVVNLLDVYALGLGYRGPGVLRWLMLLAIAGLATWALVPHERNSQNSQENAVWRSKAAVALFVGLPLALIFVLGQFTPLWVPRYLLFFLPPLLVLVAAGWERLWAWQGLLVAFLLVLGSLWALGDMYSQQQKEDWRGVATYLAREASPHGVIVLMDEECRVPLDYYDRSHMRRIEVSRFADSQAIETAVQQVLYHGTLAVPGERLFLVISHADGTAVEERLDALPKVRRIENPPFVGIRVVTYAWL